MAGKSVQWEIEALVKTTARNYGLSDEIAQKITEAILAEIQPGDASDVIVNKLQALFRPYTENRNAAH